MAGARGWCQTDNEEDLKILKREAIRLELSITGGIKQYGEENEMIVFMHYPPITTENKRNEFTDILEKYNVKKCIYGHLHGKAHANAIEGIHNGVEYIMTSCDYTKFTLIKI